MQTLMIGLAIGAFALIVTRKDGPRGIIAWVRSVAGTPLGCSVCAAFWAWLLLSPVALLPGPIRLVDILVYGGALGAALLMLALAGALDLDR